MFINIFSFINLVIGLVAQWITRLTTDQKIPGSNPGELGAFFLKMKNCQADCSALYPLPAPLNGRVSPYSA